jgi:hypothetical protein
MSFGHLPLASIGYTSVPPLSVGHLPQIRQEKFWLRIEQLNRRICPQGASRGETWRWECPVLQEGSTTKKVDLSLADKIRQ